MQPVLTACLTGQKRLADAWEQELEGQWGTPLRRILSDLLYRTTRLGQAQEGLPLQHVGDRERGDGVRERQLQQALLAGIQLAADPASRRGLSVKPKDHFEMRKPVYARSLWFVLKKDL